MKWHDDKRIDNCKICGKPLPHIHRGDKKTCSNACRQKAYRERLEKAKTEKTRSEYRSKRSRQRKGRKTDA